jgi:hypothetical protein
MVFVEGSRIELILASQSGDVVPSSRPFNVTKYDPGDLFSTFIIRAIASLLYNDMNRSKWLYISDFIFYSIIKSGNVERRIKKQGREF